jgi:hypothetical protein
MVINVGVEMKVKHYIRALLLKIYTVIQKLCVTVVQNVHTNVRWIFKKNKIMKKLLWKLLKLVDDNWGYSLGNV